MSSMMPDIKIGTLDRIIRLDALRAERIAPVQPERIPFGEDQPKRLRRNMRNRASSRSPACPACPPPFSLPRRTPTRNQAWKIRGVALRTQTSSIERGIRASGRSPGSAYARVSNREASRLRTRRAISFTWTNGSTDHLSIDLSGC